MAIMRIPRKRLAPKTEIRRARSYGGVTRVGGLPAVRMAWDTLDEESILNSKGLTKRGVPASSLVFAGVTKPMVGAMSNVRLEKASKDPVFMVDSDFPSLL